MPDATILIELTRAILAQQGTLKVLLLRSINRAPNGYLPSWVPVWNQLYISRPWVSELTFREWDEREGVVGPSRVWNLVTKAVSVINSIYSEFLLPPQSSPIDFLSFDGDRLKVKGIIFDVIDVIDGIPSQLQGSELGRERFGKQDYGLNYSECDTRSNLGQYHIVVWRDLA